ncbi:MAG: CehA/McbA family metallohydrolase [Deltaproteobacteria bacterium]|nr:CehA/McbA family metallohydrolase [Deltaproteobacteria bacterium]MBW2345728.1 CehA/McbA family metallohydrolase [Deltaproteobacteria bacterium]
MKSINFEYTGNLHIHSCYSDGAGTVPEIASAAQRLGLDFVIINDHDYMAHDLHLEDEGYYGGVLVLMGMEIGKRYHHYLAYDLKEMVKGHGSGPQEVIDRVNAQGGFGFLAHPFEKGMPFFEKSIAYTWNDLSVTGFTGICIWNFSSRWKERVKSAFHAMFFLLFKSRMLKGPNKKTMSFWDDLCRKKRVVAMGGSDAHGAGFRWGPLSLTPLTYDYTLNSINVHILSEARLTKDFAEAKTEIYGALKEGRIFIAHDNLLPAKGFRFYYVSDDGSSLIMGSEKPFKPGTLYIKTPLKGKIRLLKNGSVIKQWRGQKASYRIGKKGVYRVEVYCYMFPFGWRAWIFSNPIYLR